MVSLNTLILLGWVAFWAYWLVSAAGSKKNTRSDFKGFFVLRIGILILALILINTSFYRTHITSEQLSPSNDVVRGIGTVLFLSGLLFAIWARVHLGKNWGMPMSLKKDPELVTSGPYKFVRHPIYTGILTAMLGTTLAVHTYWLIFLVIIGAYFVYSAKVEEKIMSKQFPKAYPEYKKNSKMLIPFIF